MSFICEVVQKYMKHKHEHFKLKCFPIFSVKDETHNSEKKKKKDLVLKSENRKILNQSSYNDIFHYYIQ